MRTCKSWIDSSQRVPTMQSCFVRYKIIPIYLDCVWQLQCLEYASGSASVVKTSTTNMTTTTAKMVTTTTKLTTTATKHTTSCPKIKSTQSTATTIPTVGDSSPNFQTTPTHTLDDNIRSKMSTITLESGQSSGN